MRKVLIVSFACSVLFLGALLVAGPVTSGAVFLLLPAPAAPADHDLPQPYEPLHEGYVAGPTGLYVRENEDLVVRGTPALILRRTYLSSYRASREFGIGTTHDGERYVIGDGDTFRWAALIHANGTRVTFDRTSSGLSFFNAMYVHRGGPAAWQDARLGWTGADWALRKSDGTLARFQPCGHGNARSCSITLSRDQDGHTTHYRRNRSGLLLKMEAGNAWIAFDYDAENRIVRAHASTGADARYGYDQRGRLTQVSASDGTIRRYTYTDRDELSTISEPGGSIENTYDDNGRVIRQVSRSEVQKPHTSEWSYRLDGKTVVQTDVRESDGTWAQYTWNKDGYATAETRGREGSQPAVFTYERDRSTNIMTSLTLTCPDRTGRPLRHTSLVRPDNQEWIEWDLLKTHCSWRAPARAREIAPARSHGSTPGTPLH